MATTPGADAEADSIAMTTTGVSEEESGEVRAGEWGVDGTRWVRRMLRGEGRGGGEDTGKRGKQPGMLNKGLFLVGLSK